MVIRIRRAKGRRASAARTDDVGHAATLPPCDLTGVACDRLRVTQRFRQCRRAEANRGDEHGGRELRFILLHCLSLPSDKAVTACFLMGEIELARRNSLPLA